MKSVYIGVRDIYPLISDLPMEFPPIFFVSKAFGSSSPNILRAATGASSVLTDVLISDWKTLRSALRDAMVREVPISKLAASYSGGSIIAMKSAYVIMLLMEKDRNNRPTLSCVDVTWSRSKPDSRSSRFR